MWRGDHRKMFTFLLYKHFLHSKANSFRLISGSTVKLNDLLDNKEKVDTGTIRACFSDKKNFMKQSTDFRSVRSLKETWRSAEMVSFRNPVNGKLWQFAMKLKILILIAMFLGLCSILLKKCALFHVILSGFVALVTGGGSTHRTEGPQTSKASIHPASSRNSRLKNSLRSSRSSQRRSVESIDSLSRQSQGSSTRQSIISLASSNRQQISSHASTPKTQSSSHESASRRPSSSVDEPTEYPVRNPRTKQTKHPHYQPSNAEAAPAKKKRARNNRTWTSSISDSFYSILLTTKLFG